MKQDDFTYSASGFVFFFFPSSKLYRIFYFFLLLEQTALDIFCHRLFLILWSSIVVVFLLFCGLLLYCFFGSLRILNHAVNILFSGFCTIPYPPSGSVLTVAYSAHSVLVLVGLRLFQMFLLRGFLYSVSDSSAVQ